MKCAACGAPLPQGAAVCPACHAPVQTAYQQSYVQYQPGSYPPGYQPPYTYGEPPQEDNSFLTVLADLPRAFLNVFTRPGEVLKTMVERRDLYTCPVVAAVVLVLAFLGGMMMMRSFVGVLFDWIAALSGITLAGSSASMNQGISYIAGRVAPSVGGIAVVCQLICMLTTTIVFMLYICVVCKVMFSWELALGFLTVTAMPTAAFALLAMALSLLSPWDAVLMILLNCAVSFTLACAMLAPVTGRSDQQLLGGKLACLGLTLVLAFVLCGVAGGFMMGGVVQRMVVLFANVGSLI